MADALGDVGRLFQGDAVGGLIDIFIAASLLMYIRSKAVRATFLEPGLH